MKNKLLSIFDKIIIPVMFITANLFVLIEFTTHTNFILETTGINYVKFYALATFILLITLTRQSKQFYQHNVKKIIFILPLLIFILLMITFMRYHSFFIFLRKEDSVIEWLQFIFIAMSSVLSFLLYRYWKKKNKILAIIFLILASGLFIVAGEEISWGQRILHFKTPEKYKELNTQGETTIHNYGPVFGVVYRAYMLIGFIGMIGWIFKPLFKKITNQSWQTIFTQLIPDWQYSLYFATAFIYNFNRFYLNPITGTALWEEVMELILFLGTMLFFLNLYLKTKTNK